MAKRYRIQPDNRRPLFWWGVVIVGAIVGGGIALTAWWDSRVIPEPPRVPETGGAALYLPAVPQSSAPYVWPACRTVLDVYSAWEAAGLVTEPLRAAFVVGSDLAVPDGCLPYVRYRAAGHAERGEVYLCANRADIGALRAVRGAGRWVYSCGPWLLAVPTGYPQATADALAAVVVDACERGMR